MPDPVFSAEDRVATVELPAELKGVTDPGKIAAYYQRREGLLREEMRRVSTVPPNSRVTVEQRVDNPPDRANATFSADEAAGARTTIIATARQTAKVGKPYWDRLTAEIEQLMGAQPPENQVNVQIWETCYNTLVGMNIERLNREDRERAEAVTRAATERSSLPPTTPTAPSPLPVEVTSKILPGLNLTEEQYRTSQDNISAGKWPLTAENVSGKRVTIGGR